MNKRILIALTAFCLILLSSACQVVKPYQRAYLNDHEMSLGDRELDRFQNYVHAYREGATGGGSGKASGGCGCN